MRFPISPSEEMGTLGSGNHYLEVQEVVALFDAEAARVFDLHIGDIVVSIHCGSRGLGHQIGTEFLKRMAIAAHDYGIALPDRELACAPIASPLGRAYLGATRALGPGHRDLPDQLRAVGQPVLIGGSMGTASHILVGTKASEQCAFSSACHGAGRAMSRHAATRQWQGRQLVEQLAQRGILIRSPSLRGVAEEAPQAYKDVDAVVDAANMAGLARKVARLEPLICIKG